MENVVLQNIARSATLHTDYYTSQALFEQMRDSLFARSWLYTGDEDWVRLPGQVCPVTQLEGYLDEPYLITRDKDDQVHVLSNVCTHRGNIVCENAGKANKLICNYHGRRWKLDGSFEHMPEFDGVANFPTEADNLPRVPTHQWGPFLFTAIDPAYDFQAIFEPLNRRVGFLPLHEFRYDETRSKDYLVNANWALYIDNYLEGFHIPFVHPDLNQTLDYGAYATEAYDYLNLQIGYAQGGEDTFDLPEDHPDYGHNVGGYYFYIFPNLTLNFYTWGLSLNVIRPLSPDLCKVSFRSYVWDESKLGRGAGALLDKVEREDEYVVENVQKGVRSRFYHSGRYSAKREECVHHFHRLLQHFCQR